jgi:hypothetical protein
LAGLIEFVETVGDKGEKGQIEDSPEDFGEVEIQLVVGFGGGQDFEPAGGLIGLGIPELVKIGKTQSGGVQVVQVVKEVAGLGEGVGSPEGHGQNRGYQGPFSVAEQNRDN